VGGVCEFDQTGMLGTPTILAWFFLCFFFFSLPFSFLRCSGRSGLSSSSYGCCVVLLCFFLFPRGFFIFFRKVVFFVSVPLTFLCPCFYFFIRGWLTPAFHQLKPHHRGQFQVCNNLILPFLEVVFLVMILEILRFLGVRHLKYLWGFPDVTFSEFPSSTKVHRGLLPYFPLLFKKILVRRM